MMATEEVLEWVQTLVHSGTSIAIDDGGLTLIEINADGKETGCYLEIGGVPLKEEA